MSHTKFGPDLIQKNRQTSQIYINIYPKNPKNEIILPSVNRRRGRERERNKNKIFLWETADHGLFSYTLNIFNTPIYKGKKRVGGVFSETMVAVI